MGLVLEQLLDHSMQGLGIYPPLDLFWPFLFTIWGILADVG